MKRHSRSRRLICLAVILCMCLTSMPGISYAAEAALPLIEDVSEYGHIGTDAEDAGNDETKQLQDVTAADIIEEASTESMTTYDLGNGKRASIFYS